jgi:predicted RNA binding protein YcfA (HicA-like mRNA interferase family)
MKGKDLVKLLQQNGWCIERINGSHHIMKKGSQTEIIPVHNTDIPIGLLNKILNGQSLNSLCPCILKKGAELSC